MINGGINKIQRLQDLEKLVKDVDITPTLYENAENKYKALGNFFEKNGLDCEIYPQGSFALGTVTRPYREGKEKDYDLDFICLVKKSKSDITPKDLKHLVGDLLKGNDIYKNILKEWEKCWTLEYADINGIGFNIDILPAVNEAEFSSITKIAITDRKGRKDLYHWLVSNPKGYSEWFLNINELFLEAFKNRELREFTMIKNSVEMDELPSYFKRSSMQKVIQILKRHRDVYFYNIKKLDKKPISAIITTICAQICRDASKELDVVELLKYVASEIVKYSELQILSEDNFIRKYNQRNIIKKTNDRWEILNPVNSEDNLADQWNDDNEKAILFFRWITLLENDFSELFVTTNEKFLGSLQKSFGENYVNKSINTERYIPKAIPIINRPEPWRK